MTTEDSKSARMRAVEAIRAWYVRYPGLETIRQQFDRMRDRDNSPGESGCMLLHGPSRSGKTRLITDYVEDHPPVRGEDGDRQEVVYIKAPYPCTPKNLMEQVARDLGHPRPNAIRTARYGRGGRLFDTMDVVLSYARELGVRLMFIDEIHQMIDQKNNRAVMDGATLLKDLVNEATFCLVVSGTSSAKRIFECHEELRGRMLGNFELQPFQWYDVDRRATFITLLERLDGELPFERSGLADDDMAVRIHVASRGLIGEVAKLIENAGILAVQQDAPRILMRHLAEAFEMAALEKGGANPFLGPTPKPQKLEAPPPGGLIIRHPGMRGDEAFRP